MNFSGGIDALWRRFSRRIDGRPTAEQLVTLSTLAQRCGRSDVERAVELLRSCASGGGETPIDEAVKILGPAQVVTYDEATQCWWREKQATEPPTVPWRAEYLRLLTKTSAEGVANWWLVYVFGIPLVEQIRLRSSKDIKPNFREHTDPRQFVPQGLLRRPSPLRPRYCLLDLSGLQRYRDQPWLVQEREITAAGQDRASIGLVTEAVLTIGALKRVTPLNGFAHWGTHDRAFEEPKAVMQIGDQLCLALHREVDSKIPWGAVVVSL